MKRLLLISSLLALAMSALAQNYAPDVRTLDPASQKKIRFLNSEYLVYLPKTNSNANIPLLIYLHGSGGRGDDINKVKGQGRQLWHGIEKFNKGPCIVVAPQCLRVAAREKQSTWTPEDLNILLKHLKATLPIDSHRIYLTGNSMGGYGSWVWGAHNPEHFAAVAPVSGGLGREGPKDVTPDLTEWAATLAKVPVYAFAGGKDKVVPAERSERLIAAIREAGGKNAKLKIYPKEGHGAGRVVYSTSEFYDWMFSQRTQQTHNDKPGT